MPGVKFLAHANHVLEVLASHEAWYKSQRELGHVTGLRPSLLSEVIRVLEETGRVERGAALPGPGRQHALIVTHRSPLSAADIDPACGTGAVLATVLPIIEKRVAGLSLDEVGTSIVSLLREMAERLEELAAERIVASERLQGLRESREEERVQADMEIVRLKREISDLQEEVADLRCKNQALSMKLGGGHRSVAAIGSDARQLLQHLDKP